MAETYKIYNYKDMLPQQVAIFCKGLREDARIMMKYHSQSVSLETLLIASLLDKVNLLLWSKTVDGQKNRNRPKSVVDVINKIKVEKEEKIFETGEDFEMKRKKLIEKGG